jgi:hypothetical protein
MPELEPCSCPLAGWCERHQRKKTPHLHHLCQTSAQHRLKWDKDPPLKKLVRKASKLGKAVKKWMAAGAPVRTQPEIDAAFSICHACEFFQPLKHESGTCQKCGCFVNRNGLLNKIRMATESCPEGKW